jgi:hypothetical protein
MPNPARIDKKIVHEKYSALISDKIKVYDWADLIKMVRNKKI